MKAKTKEIAMKVEEAIAELKKSNEEEYRSSEPNHPLLTLAPKEKVDIFPDDKIVVTLIVVDSYAGWNIDDMMMDFDIGEMEEDYEIEKEEVLETIDTYEDDACKYKLTKYTLSIL